MLKPLPIDLREGLRSHAFNTVYWPQRAPVVVDKHLPTFYRAVADVIGTETRLLYIEFGVAHGKSLTETANIYSHRDSRFYGFDSFVGLPEDWLMHKAGAFSNQGRPPKIDDPRIQFVQGWFQNSVPGTLERIAKTPYDKLLIHIDCDLYSATLFLLSQLWGTFNEYYFIFDDFLHDEIIAVYDFLRSFPNACEFLIQTRGGGETPNPDQVFGRMTRTELRVD